MVLILMTYGIVCSFWPFRLSCACTYLYHTLPQGPVIGLALTWLKETLRMDLNLGKIQLLNKKMTHLVIIYIIGCTWIVITKNSNPSTAQRICMTIGKAMEQHKKSNRTL